MVDDNTYEFEAFNENESVYDEKDFQESASSSSSSKSSDSQILSFIK